MNIIFCFFLKSPIARFNRVLITIIIIAVTLLFTQLSHAGSDLDDDISKYTDDSISKWDELGTDTVNINFIIAEALGRIKRPDEEDIIQNSVIVGPGATVGDVYNIHLNESGESAMQTDEDDKDEEK